MASDFEEDLLQDLSGDERGVLGELLVRLLRRVEHAQPDSRRGSPTWTEGQDRGPAVATGGGLTHPWWIRRVLRVVTEPERFRGNRSRRGRGNQTSARSPTRDDFGMPEFIAKARL